MKLLAKKKHRVLIIIFAFLSVFLGFRYLLVTSGSHTYAFDLATQNERVVNTLGMPIRKGFFQGGNVSINADFSKTASIYIPVHGSKKSGVIVGHANKEKKNSEWFFSELYVELNDQQCINIIK
ncbi:MAG: cytochrome c oxidase assembly factor 1 family protein [Desulfobulbaceae bacterium]|nr:cytochrome c oxidase assembly factor 1 family protein [Desulfobulbaceae bacterium]